MNKKLIILALVFTIIFTIFQTYSFYNKTEETIVVGYLPSNHHSALFVADANKIFEKKGIKVQLVPFRTGQEIIKAIERGQIDIGYCGLAPVTSGIDRGVPMKIISSVNQEGSGIVVGKNKNIKSISDLKGKKIAIPDKGTVQDILLTNILNKNNISRNEVNINKSEVPFMPKSLLFNEFDAYIAWEPYVSIARTEGDGRILMYSEDLWNNHPCCVVIVRDEFAKKRPDSVKRFLKAHVEATAFTNSNKDETASIIAKKLRTDVEVEKEALKHVEFVSDPSHAYINNVLEFIKIQKKLGYIKNNLSKDDIFDLKYLP